MIWLANKIKILFLKKKYLDSKYTFIIYNSVHNLPKNWDLIAGSNLFLTHDYLKVLDVSAPKNMQCLYVGTYENDSLVGVMLSQMVSITEVKSFGVNKSCLRGKIRDLVFKKVANHVLFLGNNMLTGQNSYQFADNIDLNTRGELVKNVVFALEKFYRKKNQRIDLSIIKDFGLRENTLLQPVFSGFYNFEIQPNMVFDIKDEWAIAEDYVVALSKKYRDQFKRARKKMESVEKRKMTLYNITENEKRIYELYLNVTKNAPFNTFYLAENHFAALKKELQHNFHFYGYFENGVMIGFNTLIKNGNSLETYFLGYDDNVQRDRMLYLNMLYDMIGFSINKKFKEIVFARTALEIKSSVGAKPVAMYGFIKHRNRIINRLMTKVFRYFEPEVLWKERNPFR